MKALLSIIIILLLSTSVYLGSLFVKNVSQIQLPTNLMYYIAIFVIFSLILIFSIYVNINLFNKKLTVTKWMFSLFGLIFIQIVLWALHIVFFSSNPDISNGSWLLLLLIASLKSFDGSVLMYYMLKNYPHKYYTNLS